MCGMKWCPLLLSLWLAVYVCILPRLAPVPKLRSSTLKIAGSYGLVLIGAQNIATDVLCVRACNGSVQVCADYVPILVQVVGRADLRGLVAVDQHEGLASCAFCVRMRIAIVAVDRLQR